MATPLTADQMLKALKAEGLTVHEHAGWRTHNRDQATGKPFGPVHGVLIHHTAGHDDLEVCYKGRPDLPGPLCHAWLGKTKGLWMVGNGRANHAGLVDSDVIAAVIAERALPHDDRADIDGNDLLYGLEIENLGTGKDPYPAEQYRQAVLWAAAICRAHGWTEKSIAGHKEVQPGKIDPSFDMDGFRADVRAQLAKKPTAAQPGKPAVKPASQPSVDLSKLADAARRNPAAKGTPVTYAGVKTVEAALVAEGLLAKSLADGHYGTATVTAYAKWQRRYSERHKLRWTSKDCDGLPGKASLEALGKAHGFRVVA